jgi:preprotein translocase subunit SecG
MTYVLAFIFLVLTGALCLGLAHVARDWAEDRERERRYADEWAAAHRDHQRKRT